MELWESKIPFAQVRAPYAALTAIVFKFHTFLASNYTPLYEKYFFPYDDKSDWWMRKSNRKLHRQARRYFDTGCRYSLKECRDYRQERWLSRSVIDRMGTIGPSRQESILWYDLTGGATTTGWVSGPKPWSMLNRFSGGPILSFSVFVHFRFWLLSIWFEACGWKWNLALLVGL